MIASDKRFFCPPERLFTFSFKSSSFNLDKICLNLDEPTNHLDLEMIEWLESYFAKENITLFMVTHDQFFYEKVLRFVNCRIFHRNALFFLLKII